MFTDYGCWIRGTTYFKLLTSVAEPGYFGRSRDILAGAGILSYFGRSRFEGDSGSSLDEKDNFWKDIIFLCCNKTLIQIKIKKQIKNNKCFFSVGGGGIIKNLLKKKVKVYFFYCSWSRNRSRQKNRSRKKKKDMLRSTALDRFVYLGEMSPEGAPCSHLNPADGLHGAGGLGQGGVAGRLPALPDGILEVLRLLTQLLQLIHGGGGGWRWWR